MAIEFRDVHVRSPWRARLIFSQDLGAGAFVPGFYALVSQDGFSENPGVVTVLPVQDLPAEVELVLNVELAPGALYELQIAAGVPGADATTAPEAVKRFRTGAPARAPSASFTAQDIDELIFGVDLLHDGQDFRLGPDEDVATLTGPQNGVRSVERRLISDALPYVSPEDYGAAAYELVDAPEALLPILRGRLEQQARLDDRVVRATGIQPIHNANDGVVTLQGQLEFIGKLPGTVNRNLR